MKEMTQPAMIRYVSRFTDGMRVLVVGSPQWDDWRTLHTELDAVLGALPGGRLAVLHDDSAYGASFYARCWVEKNCALKVPVHSENWNPDSIFTEPPHLVLAFPFRESRDTEAVLDAAREAGIPSRTAARKSWPKIRKVVKKAVES